MFAEALRGLLSRVKKGPAKSTPTQEAKPQKPPEKGTYFIKFDSHSPETGPFTKSELRALAEDRLIHKRSLIRSGKTDWYQISNVKGLGLPLIEPPADKIH
ncbi:GYF domain-containing protein [Blastopirellula retiformator]|nr:GYF domain-containing protein [Blastopirellula retiformator]